VSINISTRVTVSSKLLLTTTVVEKPKL